jgi:NADPH:quinone reductase
MRAWQVETLGHPPTLHHIAQPVPMPGQALVRIHACGLNFADLLMGDGKYQTKPALPFIPGLELAGEVIALGADTTGPMIGTRVACYSGQGGLADYGCFAADRLIEIPNSMSYEDAAAFLIAYGTSHLALDHKARVQPGETLYVTGAAGGVGLTAVEIGKRMGARVIASARGADKLAVARAAGADHVIDSTSPDILDQLRALGGVDVTYDAVGGPGFDVAMRATRPDGRILAIGFASGDVPLIKANHLLVKNISVTGFWWGGYLAFAPKLLDDSLDTLLTWYAAGDLHPHVSNILAMEDLATGLDMLRNRSATGKIVIRMT